MFAQQRSLFGVIGYHCNILASNMISHVENLMLSVCHPLLPLKTLVGFQKKEKCECWKSLLEYHLIVDATVSVTIT